MGALIFTLLILFLASVLDRLVPEETKARMVDKFMEVNRGRNH